MQNGDLTMQSTENVVTRTMNPEPPVAVESAQTAIESAADALPNTAVVAATSCPQLSRFSRLQSRIGTLWQRLRSQRRKAAAVIVLAVTAIVWFETGSSETGSAANSQVTLDSYDSVLVDFDSGDDSQAMRESADPFETPSLNSFDSELHFPSSANSVQSDPFTTAHKSADSGRSTPATIAQYPDSAFSGSATHPTADDNSGQQKPRKVKFAGRIQPAN